MSMTDPQGGEARAGDLAARLAPLDLTARLHLIAREVPGRLVFTTSLGIEDQVLTHAIALAKLAGARIEIATLDTGRLFPETYDTGSRPRPPTASASSPTCPSGRRRKLSCATRASTASAARSPRGRPAAASARSSRSGGRLPAPPAGSPA